MKKKTIEKQKKYLPGYNGKAFSQGNKKLPESTIIANLSSGENCPARKKGLCKVARYCYARKCERIYPLYLRKNLAIEQWINDASDEEIYDLLEAYINDYEN